jgi:hypothetical protein
MSDALITALLGRDPGPSPRMFPSPRRASAPDRRAHRLVVDHHQLPGGTAGQPGGGRVFSDEHRRHRGWPAGPI